MTSMLCLLRHASNEQEVWDLGKEVIGMPGTGAA